MQYMMKGLVEESKRGENHAKEEIIKRLTPLIISSIRRYYFGDEEFSDLIQDGSIKILEVIKSYDEKTGVPFLGYVKLQLKYLYLGKIKKVKRETSLDKEIIKEEIKASFIDLLEDEEVNIEENFIKKEDYKALAQIINTLTNKQKRIIKLHYGEKITMKQIAKDLGLNYQTIVKTKRRALDKIRKLVIKE